MTAGLESQVRELAHRITEAGAKTATRVFHMSWWSERMLDWAMSHPAFKTQLFRFVDVFPACRDDAEVMRHLEEYFEGTDVPSPLAFGLGAADHIPFGDRITAAVARRNIVRMAEQFIAGATASEAMPRLRNLWRHGEACTVDLLGEKTITEAEADRYAERVAEMLDTLAIEAATWPEDVGLETDPWGRVPKVNISVKPTALAPRFSPLQRELGLGEALDRLHPICHRARELGATVHLDMEHADVKDLTLDLIRHLGDAFDDVQLGVVVQAYLRDSFDDLHALVEWSAGRAVPVQVRLVKGAYWDQETIVARAHAWPVPVFERKDHTDANFERCVDLMLDRAGDVRPAFGSHNIRSIAYAMAAARARGLHDTAYEVQLLYGMAEPIHAALRRLGLRVRAYAPVGALVPGMAYLVRRLLENTSNESFLRHRFAEGQELEELIAPPGVDELPGLEEPVRGDTFVNEPVREFRRRHARDAFGAAVNAKRKGFDAPVLIGGKRVKTSEVIVSVDPGAYDTEVCRSGSASRDEADRAIEVASNASWGSRPAAERAAVLTRAAAIMRERRDELAALEVFEAGKPWAEADADVCEAIDFCEYYAREALRLDAGGAVLQAPGETNAYRYRPRGVGVVIAPWNFPLAIPTGMVTAALATGNCVLFKPAEQTPGIAWRLVEILLEAGVDRGALAFLPGVGEDVGAYLVDHPEISFVSFTGSKAVGLHIVEQAAVHRAGQRHVKRVVAEMGGKNATVIDTDADLDVAVPAIVSSAFNYAGQKCSAASRVIAIGDTVDELCHRLVGATRLVVVGHASEMATQVGPLIDADAFDRVRRYADLAANEGEVLIRRDDVSDGGWYAGPTVMYTDDPGGRVATEEIFGPVLAVMRADDFDHAMALANAGDYALTGGLFSRSPARIREAVDRFRVGNLYVNRAITGALVGRQPFGGVGLSGVGSKAGGPDYLVQFTEPQVVTENTLRQGFAPLD